MKGKVRGKGGDWLNRSIWRTKVTFSNSLLFPVFPNGKELGNRLYKNNRKNELLGGGGQEEEGGGAEGQGVERGGEERRHDVPTLPEVL